MADIKDNTVSSANQTVYNGSVFGEDGTGRRILFLGNSITSHSRREEIGWYGDWGMAASSRDKDYVHQTMARVREIDKNASFLVAQVSEWEREFWNDDLVTEKYADALNYNPDIIVMRAVENVRDNDLKEHDFAAAYKKLLDRFNRSGKAKVILTSSFWATGAKDKIILDVAQATDWKYVYLCDLGKNNRYMAVGLFEHQGVAIRPGDEGMAEIANRIFFAMKEYI